MAGVDVCMARASIRLLYMEFEKGFCTLFHPHHRNNAHSRVLCIIRLHPKYTDLFPTHHQVILTVETVRKSPAVSSRRPGMSACASTGFERSILKSSMRHISMPHE